MALITRTSTRLAPRGSKLLRRRSSAVSATLARRTKPTIPTPSRRSSSNRERMHNRGGRGLLSPFFTNLHTDIRKRGIMKYRLPITLLAVAFSAASAQVASHTPTAIANTASAQTSPLQVSDRPVARVNGAVLTDRDLLREMYAIFPYAQQHNGFPKAQEAAIRQGALEMIIFEELVYQEAERRKLTIAVEKLTRAEAQFRGQFDSPDQYQQYVQSEMNGSEQQVRQQIRRSLLIEQVLKTDVELRDTATPAEVQAYYQKNAARFKQPETFTFQSVSIVPPLKATADQAKQARTKAEDALRQAKA